MECVQDLLYDHGRKILDFLLSYEYKIQGEEIPKRAIIASTHSSRLDARILVHALDKRIVFLSRKVGKLPTYMGRVILNGSLRENLESVRRYLERGYYFGIFPQGGKFEEIREGYINQIKEGVLFFSKHLQIPIVPVAIKGITDIVESEENIPRRKGIITINVGRPMGPNMYSNKGERKELSEALKQELHSLYHSC